MLAISWLLFYLICSSESSSHEMQQYSSYFCIGNPWYYHTLKPKIFGTHCRPNCIFKNICYDDAKDMFLFFRHPSDAKSPLLYDGFAKAHFDFPADFSYRDRAYLVRMSVVLGPSWNDSTSPEPRYRTVILSPPSDYYGENFGHFFFQYFVPVYSLLRSFRVEPYQATILARPKVAIADSSNTSRAADRSKVTAPFRFDGFIPYLNTNQGTSQGAVGQLRGSGSRCFDRLVLGDFICEDRKNEHARLRPSIPDFPESVSLGAGAAAAGTSNRRRLQITMLPKAGRRAPTNFLESVAALRRAFPGVSVVVLDVATATPAMQVQTLQTTTLLISPAGGIACGAPFLPRGSILLQYGFYSTHIKASYDYDSPQFAEFSQFSTVIFPVAADELSTSRWSCYRTMYCKQSNGATHRVVHNSREHRKCKNAFEDQQVEDWGNRVYCNFTVNLTRLEDMAGTQLNNYLLFNRGQRLRPIR